ncbi:MAG: CoA transferase [Parvibaculaceae bacterium]
MAKVLQGLRVIEGSAFVAAPLAGMTLAQLGADVIRFDRIGGGLDHHRWPVTKDSRSLYWAGLNKGKRSIAVDIATPRGQEIIRRLICGPGPDGGIFLTNLNPRGALSYDELRKHREDVLMVSLLGDRLGGPQVDYTVNAGSGFPFVTGPSNLREPVNHALPAWDVIAGNMAALAVLAAERHRLKTGQGQLVELSLKDVALAVLGHLGIIADVALNHAERERLGNAVHGAYVQDFSCVDGRSVIVVGLTKRQWESIRAATGLGAELDALEERLGLDLAGEGNRFLARDAITDVLAPWFRARSLEEVAGPLKKHGVTWGVFRSFTQALAEDPDLSTENPMFSMVDHPGIGSLLTPGTPIAFQGAERETPVRAPLLGEHTDMVLAEAGYSATEIAALHDAGVVAGTK